MATETPKPKPSRFRKWFRRCRIAILLGVLAVVAMFIYCNRVGVPGFIQRPMLAALKERGVDLQFDKLHLRWYRGFVADNVKFARQAGEAAVAFTARSADLKLRGADLWRGKFTVDAVAIHMGRLEWAFTGTNATEAPMVIDLIEARLRLPPGDEWELEDFRARCAGARFIVSGDIRNATAMRDWDMFRRPGKAPAGTMRERLRRFFSRLDKIPFSTPPELRLRFDGDGRDPQSFTARLSLKANDALTEWGALTNVLLMARLHPASSNVLSRVEARLEAKNAATPWTAANGLRIQLELDATPGETNQFESRLEVRAQDVASQWAGATNVHFTSRALHSISKAVPLSGEGELVLGDLTTRLAGAREVRVRGSLLPGRGEEVNDPAWAWWTNLSPHRLAWQAQVLGVRSEQIVAEKLDAAGLWSAPMLTLTNVHADLKDGPFDATAALDVASREATFQVASDFDVQQIAPLLREKARAWLAKYSWQSPPHLTGSGALILPAWTNLASGWKTDVLPTLRLAAELAVTNGAYLGLPADWAHTHITYTNQVWHLPDFRAAHGASWLEFDHIADDRTRDYLFRVHASADPRIVRPLLATNAQRGLDYFEFTQNPVVDGELWGRWRQYDRIGFQGTVALSNFTFRGQSFDAVTSALRYTNRFLEFLEPRAWRQTTQTLSAAGVAVELETQRVHFTNGFSTAEPLVVARCIGPITGRTMEAYQFEQPPTVRVEGFAPLRGQSDADLRFDVDGGPFAWWKFHLPHVTGNLRWQGDHLEISRMRADFYEGQAEGNANFEFHPGEGTTFQFFANATNVNLQRIVPDLFAHTNRLEGLLSGMLGITNANSADPNSWFGWTHWQMRDGMIWEIPIFGVFSEPLNAVAPGLGSSRLSQAQGQMAIANSVMHFEKLEMRSRSMRLQYRGTVDMAGNVDAVVEAEPLRDTWIVGPLVTLALKPMTKLFEYKVTGTLAHPKKEPLYLPTKLLLMPLHPFQTLDDWFSVPNTTTNAPSFGPQK